MYRRLELIRAKMLEIKELDEQAARIGAAYKSPAFDGMPKAGGGNAMDARMIALEQIEARRDALKSEVCALEDETRGAIVELPAQLYSFCVVFFIGAMTVAETCKVLDRDETTLYRYKREVKKMLCQCQ